MDTIASKEEILAALQSAQNDVFTTSAQLDEGQFFAQVGDSWSAAGYLKHLILSVKPFARALELPREHFAKMFGKSDGDSKTYAELITFYQSRLADGLRAEQAPDFVPESYKLPDDVGDDGQAYLLETWHQANERLLKNMESWSEADLDAYILPHPAIGKLTVREMCYFTIYHNRLHARDIEQAISIE